MKRVLIALGIAAAAFGCEGRNSTNTAKATHSDDTSGSFGGAQSDAQDQMQDAQKKMNEAQQDANKKTTEAQQDANKKAADAQKDANEKTADAQHEMKDAQAKAGETVDVTGTVSKVKDDSFALKMADGKDVDLKFTDDSGRQSPIAHQQLKEGDKVRASYTERDGDKILQNVQVLQPAHNHK